MYYNDYNRLNEQPEESMVIPAPAPDSPGPAPRKKRTGLKITALCLVCALLALGTGLPAFYFWDRKNKQANG